MARTRRLRIDALALDSTTDAGRRSAFLARLLFAASVLQHASPPIFSGMLCVVYHDTRRSSNWPIARSGPKTWPRLVSYDPIGIFLSLSGGFGRGRPHAPPVDAADATADNVEHAAADGPHTNTRAGRPERAVRFTNRPTEYPSEAPAGYGQEPVFDTPATGQIDQPVSAGYGHGGNWATATPVVQGTAVPPVASAPPVEQSSGWTWSKATPAQQANRFNM